MRGAYSVLSALFVATSSQIAAESGDQLQTFDYNVIAADNSVVQSVPNRFLQGNRGDHNDLAHEERSVYDALASMINEGVEKLPLVAEIIKTKPLAAKAAKKKPRATKAVKKKSRATKAVKKKSRAAKAVKIKSPRAAKAAKKAPPQAEVVDEMLYGVEATKEMEKSEEYGVLKAAAEGADEALRKHWNPSGEVDVIDDASRNIAANEILSFKKWRIEFRGMKSMDVSGKYTDAIKRVHEAFGKLCDDNIQPTLEETSYIWSMFDWKIASNSKRTHKQYLIRQAQRYVLIGLRKMKEDDTAWNEWEELLDPLKFGVLNYLLNLHYQRWVRMYNIFARNRPDQKPVLSNLELNPVGNTGTSTAMALESSLPSTPTNVASTSKGDHAVLTKRLRRTFNGNTDSARRPTKRSKMKRSKSVKPLLTGSTTSGHHSVSTEKLKSSFDDPSSTSVPHKPGDHSAYTEDLKPSFGGPSSAFVPYRYSNVHSSQSLAPPLALKDVETELSLGGIYDRSTYTAPSVP